MPLSKHYLDTQEEPTPVEAEAIAKLLAVDFPQLGFAYLLGSAARGVIAPHSDLDLAIYYLERPTFDRVAALIRAVEDLHRGVRCDLGSLNHAEPVYRFEALKGRLLFVRDRELWLRFYSLTCRLYESQMFHYDRQRRYRLEASSNRLGAADE
jgi:predicted nucleotidyltransferase